MSTVVKDLGAVSAYAYAVEKGYTGTEAEFAELMADYAEVGQRAEDAAESALNSNTAAQSAKTAAQTAQQGAETARDAVQASAAQITANAEDINQLKEGLSAMSTATSADVGKALKAKTVTGGKVTEWEFGEAGGELDATLTDPTKAAQAKAVGEQLFKTADLSFTLSNASIYLVANHDMTTSVESNTRVSTDIVYVPTGCTCKINASGFGKYGYSVSDNGTKITSAKQITNGTELSHEFTGPVYFRLVFGCIDNSAITPEDITLSIKTRSSAIDEMARDISSINSDIKDLTSERYYDGIWHQKGYMTSSGNWTFVTNFISTGFLPSEILAAKAVEGYSFMIFAWNENEEYVGRWNGQRFTNSAKAENNVYLSEFKFDKTNNYKYALLVKNGTGTDITIDEGRNIIFTVRSIPSIQRTVSEVKDSVQSLRNCNIVSNRDVVFTVGYIYVRRISDEFYLSTDGGHTYTKSISIPTGFSHTFGTLRFIWVFRSGTLLVCDHQYAYYTDDWESWNESTCLNADGTTYEPATYDTFTISRKQRRTIIDGREVLAFGNYNITDEQNQRDLLWYTVDDGHTLKVAYEFSVEGHIAVRHIHGVYWCEKQSNFWVCTGDFGNQSNLIKATYDVDTDTWDFAIAGQGEEFKWAGLAFYEDYFYYALDFTPGKVMCGKIGNETNPSSHYAVLEGLPNDVIGVFVGLTTGEMLVTLSTYRTGTSSSSNPAYVDAKHLWYSSDRVNFVEIDASDILNTYPESITITSAVLYMFCLPNSQGKILASYEGSSANDFVQSDMLPSVFLDDLVRSAGFECDFK